MKTILITITIIGLLMALPFISAQAKLKPKAEGTKSSREARDNIGKGKGPLATTSSDANITSNAFFKKLTGSEPKSQTVIALKNLQEKEVSLKDISAIVEKPEFNTAKSSLKTLLEAGNTNTQALAYLKYMNLLKEVDQGATKEQRENAQELIQNIVELVKSTKQDLKDHDGIIKLALNKYNKGKVNKITLEDLKNRCKV